MLIRHSIADVFKYSTPIFVALHDDSWVLLCVRTGGAPSVRTLGRCETADCGFLQQPVVLSKRDIVQKLVQRCARMICALDTSGQRCGSIGYLDVRNLADDGFEYLIKSFESKLDFHTFIFFRTLLMAGANTRPPAP